MPAPIRPAGGAGSAMTPGRSSSAGSASRHSGRSPSARTGGRCSRPSSRRQWRASMYSPSCRPGTGKSICYQVPALSRYDRTGALTVAISPLVALMADQVAGLERQGIGSCVTVNGMLSMPERADALDRVRLGDAGILITSPEQLRSRLAAPGARPARDRRLGPGRGALPVALGPRFQAGLPLRGAVHPREGRQGADTAGFVPDGDRQAGCDRGHCAPFPG